MGRNRGSRVLVFALAFAGLALGAGVFEWFASREARAACGALVKLPDVVAVSVRFGFPTPRLAIVACDPLARDRLRELLRPEVGRAALVIEAERETASPATDDAVAPITSSKFEWFVIGDPHWDSALRERERFRRDLLALPGVTQIEIGVTEDGVGWNVGIDADNQLLVKSLVRERVAGVPVSFSSPW
jgi:hypothetical protein